MANSALLRRSLSPYILTLACGICAGHLSAVGYTQFTGPTKCSQTKNVFFVFINNLNIVSLAIILFCNINFYQTLFGLPPRTEIAGSLISRSGLLSSFVVGFSQHNIISPMRMWPAVGARAAQSQPALCSTGELSLGLTSPQTETLRLSCYVM